jgi:hypothetical protein
MRVLFTTLYEGPGFKFGYKVNNKNAILISIPMLDLRGLVDMNQTQYYQCFIQLTDPTNLNLTGEIVGALNDAVPGATIKS